MTLISPLNPLAQLAAPVAPYNTGVPAAQITQPMVKADTSNLSGKASDQSGQGPGNGSGTGGAQVAELLANTRAKATVQRPTPESIVEAQSSSDPVTGFPNRQERQQTETKAAFELAEAAAARAADAKMNALEAEKPEFVMPNPLPTAPILQRDDG